MKKSFALWVTVLTVCLFGAACSEDIDDTVTDSVYLYTTEIKAPAAAGEQSITLAATVDWTATPEDNWLSVDVNSGKTGFSAVHISWTENTTGEERTGSVVFKAGTYTDRVVVRQGK